MMNLSIFELARGISMDLDMLVECHKAMGDKTRLRILSLLKTQELCGCELVEILKMTQPSVSQHLRKLKTAKLVKERREGQWVFYSIDGTVYPFIESTFQALPDLSGEIQWLRDNGLMVTCRA